VTDGSRKDIRRLLRTFGVKADEAIVEHLESNPQVKALRLRATLEDLTDYGDSPPEESLHLEVNEEIRRR
jgi:5,10-methenyltetrahydromethanopterin hydrogenase